MHPAPSALCDLQQAPQEAGKEEEKKRCFYTPQMACSRMKGFYRLPHDPVDTG